MTHANILVTIEVVAVLRFYPDGKRAHALPENT